MADISGGDGRGALWRAGWTYDRGRNPACGRLEAAVGRRYPALRPPVRTLVSVVRGFGVRHRAVVPAVIIPNPWFSRAVPVRPQDHAIWAATAVLLGLSAATYVGGEDDAYATPMFAGGLLSFLAVGGPVCSKVVVLLLGTSGALRVFARAQLVLGIGSLVLLASTLLLRVDTIGGAACTRPATRQS